MNTEIKIKNTETFIELSCEKDHYITNYKNSDDILTFSASKLLVCPLSTDIEQYHCISEEEYNKLTAERNENIKAKIVAENKVEIQMEETSPIYN